MSNMDMRLVQDNPSVNKKRSYIPFMKHKSQFDFNKGLLVPMDRPWEVLPGDTWKVKHALKMRMTNPPKVPVMDQLVLDIFFFYTPLRILWNEFDKFITGDVGTDWTQVSTLTVPTLVFAGSGTNSVYEKGSLLDYLGCPVNNTNNSSFKFGVNALPIRGYYKIWNWWFRYESMQEELYIYEGSNNENYDVGNGSISWQGTPPAMSDIYSASTVDNYMLGLRANATKCCWLAPVCKLPDVFTRCLPQPLAAPDVEIMDFSDFNITNFVIGGTSNADRVYGGFSSAPSLASLDVTVSSGSIGQFGQGPKSLYSIGGTAFSNGGVVSGITGNTIRDLRTAIQIEQIFTLEARFSRRLPDWSIAMFATNVPDFRVQQPEMLGRKRIYVNVNQVIQSSSSVTNSPQGNVGAWSDTIDSGFDFVKSFCEFGYIYSLCCVRVLNRTYSQGIDKMYSRSTRFNFYMPPLANISDQPVGKRELFNQYMAGGNPVFGYQEAWYDYKYLPNHVANHCRPDVSNTIAIWNYGEYYSGVPSFSESFIIEPTYDIDRTMYLSSSITVSQFLMDIVFDIDCYRVMPLHSVAGLMDHIF